MANVSIDVDAWQDEGMTAAPPRTPRVCRGVVGAVDPAAAQDLAQGFKALADPARVQLLALVATADEGEICACDLTGPLGLAQPTVSHHLKILVGAGLLEREQRGRWAYYSLAPAGLERLSAALRGTVEAT